MTRTIITGRARPLLCAGVLLLALAAQPLAASAQFINAPAHKWPYTSGSLLWLNYARGCAGGFATFTDRAAFSWTVTRTPIFLTAVPSIDCNGGAHEHVIDVYATKYMDPWFAGVTQNFGKQCLFFRTLLCWLYPTYTEGTPWESGTGAAVPIAASVVNLNDTLLSNWDSNVLQKAAAHEFGHSMGLAHCTSGEFQCDYSIMDAAMVGYAWSCIPPGCNTPQQRDIDDINYLYPGW